MAVNKACETCLYWRHIREGSGDCRRYPPTLNDRHTLKAHWCGEYECKDREALMRNIDEALRRKFDGDD